MSKNQDLGELINGIKSLGTNQLNAPAYTSASSFTGTLAGLLGFDSSGNVISLASTSLTLNAGQISAAIGYNPVPDNRTLTINGVTYDLTANRSWSVSGSSQWTTSGSNIYFTGGFVGINTTSPQYILDVSGGARFTAWSSMGINARFAWNMISDQYLANGYAGAIRVDNADGRFSFYTAPSGVSGAFPAQTERFTITNNGNVGINTTAPQNKLEVNGSAYFTGWSSMQLGSPFSWNSIGGTYLSNGYATAINSESSNGRIAFYTAVSGTAGTSATFLEKMTILNDGRVGINTSSPYSYVKLHVANGFRANADSATGTGTLEIYRSGGSNNIYMDGNLISLYNQSTAQSFTLNGVGMLMNNLPSSSAGSGYLWRDGSGYLRVG